MCCEIHIHNYEAQPYEGDLKASTEKGWDKGYTLWLYVCLGCRGGWVGGLQGGAWPDSEK